MYRHSGYRVMSSSFLLFQPIIHPDQVESYVSLDDHMNSNAAGIDDLSDAITKEPRRIQV